MRRAACAWVLVLLLCACGGQPATSGGSSGFPAETAEDWVTYGDYLLELTAASETTVDPDENEVFEGEGMFRRRFTLTVDSVLWSRPSVSQPPPSTLVWYSGGWQFKNGNLDRRKRVDDPDQLQTQHRYVGFCHHAGRYSDGGDPWWCTRIPMDGGTLDRPTSSGESNTAPFLAALEGMTPAEAGQLLARTPPDPAATPYLDLNAIDRYQAVAAAREATATPK